MNYLLFLAALIFLVLYARQPDQKLGGITTGHPKLRHYSLKGGANDSSQIQYVHFMCLCSTAAWSTNSSLVIGRRKAMSQKLLQVNMNFSISRAELEKAWLEPARPIADLPGLRWKVWLMNEAKHEAGGIYLFDSEAAAQSYLAGPIVAALKSSPAVSNITAKLFDVLERHTAITRGPVK